MAQTVNEPIPGIGGDAKIPGGVPQRSGVIFPAVARTASGASGGSASGVYASHEYFNPTAKGARFFVSASGPATGAATFSVQVFDPASLTWTNLPGVTTPALGGTGSGATTPLTLTVYPGLTGIADDVTGAKINQCLGLRWRGVLTIANDTSTCAVGGDYLF